MAITESDLTELVKAGAATECVVAYDAEACARVFIVMNGQRVPIGSARHVCRVFKTSLALTRFMRKVGISRFVAELHDVI